MLGKLGRYPILDECSGGGGAAGDNCHREALFADEFFEGVSGEAGELGYYFPGGQHLRPHRLLSREAWRHIKPASAICFRSSWPRQTT